MQAAVVREPGGQFRIEELRDPKPRTGEVLVRVAACGVCHTDLHIRDGSVAFPFPCVLGHEISGIVEGLGDEVEDVAVGDRVVGTFIMPCRRCASCRAGHEELCEPFFSQNRLNGTLYDGETRLYDAAGDPVWMYSMGGLAELAVMPAGAAVPIPEGMPLAESAIFGCALLTAYGATHDVAQIQGGETVAVIGVGGVGTNVVQVARALGAARIIVVDLAPEKLDAARRMGADEGVDASLHDPVVTVRELTGGRGADVVFEVIGNPTTFRQATEMAADGGRCVMIGIAPTGLTAEVEITRLVRRKLQILGSFGGRPRSDLGAVMKMTADGRLDLNGSITRRFSLQEAGVAYEMLEQGELTGRALVEMMRT